MVNSNAMWDNSGQSMTSCLKVPTSKAHNVLGTEEDFLKRAWDNLVSIAGGVFRYQLATRPKHRNELRVGERVTWV